MSFALPLNRFDWRYVPWVLVALLVGAVLTLLPVSIAVTLLAVGILVVLSLIDIRVALVVTLVIAPLKVLTETELPITQLLPLDIGQITLLVTLGIWLIRSMAARRRSILVWSPVYPPILLFIGAASLSLWNTVSLWTSVKELVIWLEVLTMAVLVVSLIRDGKVGWLVGALIVAGCVQAIIGIYEFRGGSGAPFLWILDYRYFRAFGSFGQPNPFGAFMGLILALAVGATYGSATETWTVYCALAPDLDRDSRLKAFTVIGTSTLRTLLLLVSAVILAAGLIVSWSRGAWIGFSAAALVIVFFAPRRRLVGAALVGALAAVALLGVVTGLVPASLVARFSDFSQELSVYDDVRGVQISDANYAVVERIAHWQAAVGMATDHPWLGVGFGSYEDAYTTYALLNWPMALGHAHNYYLNLLAETGIVGFSGYIIAWLIIAVLTLRVLNRETGFKRGIALGILGTWTYLTVHNFFDKLYVNNVFLHLGMMLGLIGALLLYRSVDPDLPILFSSPSTRR